MAIATEALVGTTGVEWDIGVGRGGCDLGKIVFGGLNDEIGERVEVGDGDVVDCIGNAMTLDLT